MATDAPSGTGKWGWGPPLTEEQKDRLLPYFAELQKAEQARLDGKSDEPAQDTL